ncbi:MAG: type transporter family protein [Herbinix sp.]|jgi:ABC-2 type transport system permease protein|nr:type transporter family protein [Herbinix sp.]
MKTLFIMKRIILQTVNDKRSLGLILVMPLFLFTLIFLLLGDSDYQATIAENGMPSLLVEKIEAQDVTVESYSKTQGLEEVKDKKIDAFLYKEGNETILLFETSDAVKTGVIQKALQNAMKDLMPAGVIRTEFLYGESDSNMFNSLGYVLLGIISFFVVFIIAGISFVRERTNQTMERLMITPVKRWQVVLGYTFGFGLFAMLQSILLLSYVTWVLQMTITGSIVAAGFVMILLSMSAVCIGAFFSIFANNEFQIMQFIPLVVIPQIFFSGLISLDAIPYHLGVLSRIMPVYYACSALKTIIIRGAGISEVLNDILALLIFIVLFFVSNIFALKKYRRI